MRSASARSNIWQHKDQAENHVLGAARLIPCNYPRKRGTRARPVGRTVPERMLELLGSAHDYDRHAIHPRQRIRNEVPTLKAEMLSRLGCSCEACGMGVPDAGLIHLHHVIPVSRDGDNRPGNLVLLCANCHGLAHWYGRKMKRSARPTNRTALLALLTQGRETVSRQAHNLKTARSTRAPAIPAAPQHSR